MRSFSLNGGVACRGFFGPNAQTLATRNKFFYGLATPSAVVLTGNIVSAVPTLNWTASHGATLLEYDIWRQVDNAGGFTHYDTVGPATLTYQDLAADPTSHDYEYFVIAIPVTGAPSPHSNTVSLISIFKEVDGGVLAGHSPNDLAISNALSAVIVTASNFAAHTADGGVTWALVATVAGITTIFECVCNATGTYVAHGFNGAASKILTSTDGGATWADTTPAGANVSTTFLICVVNETFFLFDQAAAKVWHSTTGSAWVGPGIASEFNPQEGTNSASACVVYGFQSPGPPVNVQMWRTTDGATFAVEEVTPSADAIPGGSPFASVTGTTHFACLEDTALTQAQFWVSTDDGVTWAQNSASTNPDLAPYIHGTVGTAFGKLFSAFDSTGKILAVSANNGVTWVPNDITATDGTFANGQSLTAKSDGSILFAYGDTISGSLDGTHWQQQLSLPAFQQVEEVRSVAGLTLAYSNAGGIYKATH